MKQRKAQETGENRLFISSIFGFEFWLFLFLIMVWTFGATSVKIEETIPESTATNSLSADKFINNTNMATPSINTTVYNNSQIPGTSNASNFLTGENLTSFGQSETERRELLGANSDSGATANANTSSINYNDIPHGYHGSNSQPNKAANPYQKSCHPGNRCRQGN